MLFGRSTKFGAGFTLAGDSFDLCDLHDTIHYLASENGPMPAHQAEFVLGFAYDVRHAYQGDREVKAVGDPSKKMKYFCFDTLWPDFLVQLGLLRSAAAYLPTKKIHQANLFRLEACAEEALNEIDANIGRQCIQWLEDFSPFPKDFQVSFISEQSLQYVTSGTTAKSRFRNLPGLLGEISPYSTAYKAYEEKLKAVAKKEKCRLEDLHDFSDWPDFRW